MRETRRWIAVDLDHTLFDSTWRDGLLGDPAWPEDPRWDVYNGKAENDEPFPHVVELVDTLRQRWDICMVTARPEKWRAMTKASLVHHHITYDELLMRPSMDSRHSPALKYGELTRRFGSLNDIDFMIDDREDVARELSKRHVSVLQAHIRKRGKL